MQLLVIGVRSVLVVFKLGFVSSKLSEKMILENNFSFNIFNSYLKVIITL